VKVEEFKANSSKELEFHWNTNISLHPLHMKFARVHWKKMWFMDSELEQRLHRPLEGP
jgi:hypothetical protein